MDYSADSANDVHNVSTPCPVAGIRVFAPDAMNALLCQYNTQGWRLALLCGVPAHVFMAEATGVCLLAILVHDATGNYTALRTEALTSYPAFTLSCPQAHWFERELYERWGIMPEGHPWLKPIRFTPLANGADGSPRPLPGDTHYFRVEGDDVHEVGVGPVHAGVIEPGHFRFQCYGETVMHLEISLGFQHRGIEHILSQLHGTPDTNSTRALCLIECVAGDTSIAHATAYATLVERLSGVPASTRGQALRSVALELERLACHTGDLGALGGDVGFLPALSWCGRIRGDFLNLSAALCGNRFGRGTVVLGGTQYDTDASLRDDMLARLSAAHRDVRGAVDILLASSTVLDRFEGTGTVTHTTARELGLVGVAARASGLVQDARWQYPLAGMPTHPARIRAHGKGDVLARARVRSEEIDDAVHIVRHTLETLPQGPCADTAPRSFVPRMLAVAFVEGWRGPVCHVGITGTHNSFAFYKMVDPSFHNWIGLAMALREQQISDFPLCNKSFNLSYCGHDL